MNINLNEPTTQSQNEKLRDIFLRGETINPIKAYVMLGSILLSARVYDVKHKYNLDIRKRMTRVGNKTFTEYYLHHEADERFEDYKRKN